MSPTVRRALAVLAGLGVAIGLIFAIEGINVLLHPLPSGIDPRDADALKAVMGQWPASALLIVLLGWGLGAFAGGRVAARVGGAKAGPARAVGLVLLVAAIYNMLTIPHPLWFWVLGILLIVPAAELGARVAGAAAAGRTPR
jgi:hypothetical protein